MKLIKINKSKGQAFSTFQLLIAAVVALALLGVLMPIIMQALGFIQSDPVSAAKTTLRSAFDSPGTVQATEAVTFSSKNREISAEGITDGTGIAADQVIFFHNGFDNDFDVIGTGTNNGLAYKKSEKMTFALNILCTAPESLSQQIENRIDTGLVDSGVNSSEFDNLADETRASRICAVFPTRAN